MKMIKGVKTPDDVLYVWTLSNLNIPMGSEMINRTIRENPDWFPEEYSRMVRFEAVPEEVRSEYFTELNELLHPLEEALPKPAHGGGGILYWAEHQDEWNKYSHKRKEVRDSQYKERFNIYKQMHYKYFYEYGLKFNKNIVYY